jgi:predicted dehydrogenase/acetyltransferase-like isoleucine patch superfamily enzyme
MAVDYFVHPSAEVSPLANIGRGSQVWNQAQIREKAEIGEECIIGKDVYIDLGVVIGDRVKIQNSVSVYHGVTIEDDVFVGPQAAFTNDLYPRADNPDWQVVPTQVQRGASIGANATIVCGVTIGERAMVGAGAVVTKDVPPYTLVVGNPARVLRRLDSSHGAGPIRTMLVGLGNMGAHHARIISGLPEEFTLCSIVEPDQARRAAAAARYPQARLLADHRDGLAEVEAVVIAAPTALHYQIARDVLASGKHCLLEKPCTLAAAQADQLYSLAESQGKLLQVGHIERFNPAVEALLHLVQDQEIVAVTAERLGLANRPTDTDVVFDLAIHDLEIVQALVGQAAVGVSARGIQRGATWDYVSSLVQYAGGAVATFTASRLSPSRKRTLAVTTDRAVYVADCLERTITIEGQAPDWQLPDWGITGQHCWRFAGPDALAKQAKSFAAGIRAEIIPPVGRNTVVPALETAELIRQQLGVGV